MGSAPEGRAFVLGIDGGATRTVCLIADEAGTEVARAVGGPSNHQAVGVEAARRALAQAIAQACDAAGNPPLAAACWGMAGLDRPEDGRILNALAAELLPGVPVAVVHDADIALVGGAGGSRVGVVVIAGTGSIAAGYDIAGRTARAGGWGHVLGDEGSGYDIARRGLNAATRASDGRAPATALATVVLAAADEGGRDREGYRRGVQRRAGAGRGDRDPGAGHGSGNVRRRPVGRDLPGKRKSGRMRSLPSGGSGSAGAGPAPTAGTCVGSRVAGAARLQIV